MTRPRPIQPPGAARFAWPRYGWCVAGSVGLHLLLLAAVAVSYLRPDPQRPDLELRQGHAGIRIEWRPAASSSEASAQPTPAGEQSPPSSRPAIDGPLLNAAALTTPTSIPVRPTAPPAPRIPAHLPKAWNKPASPGSKATPASAATAGTTTGARASYCPAPPYPTAAQRAGREGTVRLRLTIAENGRVTAAHIVESSGRRDFDEAARTTILRQWKYHPAQATGTAVSSIEIVRVEFKLEPS